MTNRTFSKLALIGAVVLGGCSSTTPIFDEHFSRSVRTLQAQQVLNPEATRQNSLRVPEGMDGRAARETLERYQKSFQNPPRQMPSMLLGTGAGAGASTD